MSFVTLTM